jgi:hypothetical protein
LAVGLEQLHTELMDARDPLNARREAIAAVTSVTPLLQRDPTLDVTVAIAQVRSMAIDLLRASGVDNDDALAAVKAAAGEAELDADLDDQDD